MWNKKWSSITTDYRSHNSESWDTLLAENIAKKNHMLLSCKRLSTLPRFLRSSSERLAGNYDFLGWLSRVMLEVEQRAKHFYSLSNNKLGRP